MDVVAKHCVEGDDDFADAGDESELVFVGGE